jgi:hypothetical protein
MVEIVLVVAVVVGVWILWRILKIQEARATLEVEQRVEQQVKKGLEGLARAIERHEAQFGPYEDAKRESRLIEWFEQLALACGFDVNEAKEAIRPPFSHGDEIQDLVHESIKRDVPCRLLEPEDYRRYAPDYKMPGSDEPLIDWVPNRGKSSK